MFKFIVLSPGLNDKSVYVTVYLYAKKCFPYIGLLERKYFALSESQLRFARTSQVRSLC